MSTKYTRGSVNVEVRGPSVDLTPDEQERCLALGEMLLKHETYFSDIFVYLYRSDTIGGLRILEISWVCGRGGCSLQRGVDNCQGATVILAAEQFLETYGCRPFRPEGWESCINVHGESVCRLLRALEKTEAANQEYQLQLAAEKLVTATTEEEANSG